MAFTTQPCCAIPSIALPPSENILALQDRSIQIELSNLNTVVSDISICTRACTYVIRKAAQSREFCVRACCVALGEGRAKEHPEFFIAWGV